MGMQWWLYFLQSQSIVFNTRLQINFYEWFSVTKVVKKFESFFIEINITDIHNFVQSQSL